MPFEWLAATADWFGLRVARRHSLVSLSEPIASVGTLPSTEEDYFIRFSNGLRLNPSYAMTRMIDEDTWRMSRGRAPACR